MCKYAKHDIILCKEPATAIEFGADTPSPRHVGIFLDPIIAHALLGPYQQPKFPLLSKAEDFSKMGYTLDPPAIAHEFRRLFFDGTVQISKRDVCRGEGDKLSFSPALHSNLLKSISEGTRSMLLEYRRMRVSVELSRHPAAELAAEGSVSLGQLNSKPGTLEVVKLASSNDTLQKQNASLKCQVQHASVRAAHYQAGMQASEQQAKAYKAELDEANLRAAAAEKRSHTFKKRYDRERYRSRRKPDLGLKGKKLIEVKNICMDPNRKREAWEKRKRHPSLAWECAVVLIRGTKEPRPIGGGVRWTVDACYREYENFAQSGMEAARRAVHLRELAMHGRVIKAYIVPTGRKGCLRRNVLFTSKQRKVRAEARAAVAAQQQSAAPTVQPSAPVPAQDIEIMMTAEQALDDTQLLDGVRLFDHPSRRTTIGVIIPTCQLLFSVVISSLLYHLDTVRIGFCCDFAKSKGFSCMGSVVSVFQRHQAFVDPRGGIQWILIVKAFKLPMTQATNKLTRQLFDSEGKLLTPQSAKCAAKALLVANCARHFLEHPEMWTITSDGASENCGLAHQVDSGAAVRDDFCGVAGLYWELMITKKAWPEVVNELKEAGLLGPLDDLFGNSDFKWPSTEVAEESVLAGEAGSPQAPLDRNGPVHKNPKIVQDLEVLYVEETQCARREAREKMLRILHEQAQGPQPNRPIKVKAAMMGPFRDADELLRRRQAAEARESKHQRLLWARRQKTLRLYMDRIRVLDESRQSTDRPVSMVRNPLRFVPGRCTACGKPLGELRHCSCHRCHNLTEELVSPLNAGFLEQCVSTATYASSEYRWFDLRAAINFLLVPSLHEAIRGRSGFYSAVKALLLEVMTLETLIEQVQFDIKKGAQPPETAGIARWGSALGAAGCLDRKAPLLAMGIIKKYAIGLPETKQAACADVLSGRFISRNYPDLQIEKHAARHFALLTTTSDLLQLGIASFVNDVVEGPLLAAISSDNECGLTAMGVESVIRAIVFVVTRDIWVRYFPQGDWGLGWNRKTTLMFRSIADFNPEASVLLLNPRCEDAVRRRLCELQLLHPSMVDKAAKAAARFVTTIKRLAGNDGPMLPEDSQKRWAEAYPEMAELIAKIPSQHADAKHTQLYAGSESFAARVSQAQWLLLQTVRACANALCDNGMHRELYGVSGWIANMGRSQQTARAYRIQMPNGIIVVSPLVIPGDHALANAVNAYVQARDLLAHYEEKGISKHELVKKLPSYCQWWMDLDQIRGFFEQTGESAWRDGPKVIDSGGAVDSKAHESLLKPLSFFLILARCSADAGACINNSKVVESSFSPMKVIGRSKGQAKFAFLSMLYRRHNFRTAELDAEQIITGDTDRYWRVQDVACLPGWDSLNVRDDVQGEVYRDADLDDKLHEKHKGVARGGVFRNPRHGGSSRTAKYRGGQAGAGAAGRGRGRKRVREESDPARRGGRGSKRARVGSDVSPADPGSGAALLGRNRGRGGGWAVRDGRGRNGNVTQLNRKRRDGTGVGSDSALGTSAKRVCRVRVRAVQPQELRGERVTPQMSQHLRRCLSNRKMQVEKERRKQRLEETRKAFAERQKLAKTGCDSEERGCDSGDDSDYCPHGSSVESNVGCSRILRERASKPAQLAAQVTTDSLAACDNEQDDLDSEQSEAADSSVAPADKLAAASQAAKARPKGHSGPCAPQPSRGRGGISGGRSKVSVGRGARRVDGRGRLAKAAGGDQVDQSDSASEGDDVPLSRRWAAVVAAEHVLHATAQPPVGAKVDIKWDPTKWKERDGWFKGTVIAISDGKLPAPGRDRRRLVEAGFSIVEYDDKNRYVHPLDKAHHVGTWGDRESAWCLLSSSESSDNAHKWGSRARVCRDPDADDSGDDRPLFQFPARASAAPPAGDAADSEQVQPDELGSGVCYDADAAHSCDSAPLLAARATAAPPAEGAADSEQVPPAEPVAWPSRTPPNVWSRTYCFDVFQAVQPGQFRRSIARYFAGSYDVTRQMPTHGCFQHSFSKEANIKIHVTATSKVCYIAYTENTGPTLFMVTAIHKPRDADWSNTLRGYQMFSTKQALARVDVEKDTIHLGCATSLGAASLRRESAHQFHAASKGAGAGRS